MNSIYYTFSTIAQVLAGFIALGGVFVLFKLQEIKKIQLQQAKYFLDFIDKELIYNHTFKCPVIAVKLKMLLNAESTDGMLGELYLVTYNNELNNKNQLQNKLILLNENYKKVNSYKNRIKRFTIISIFIAILTIALSLTVLGFAHKITESYSLKFTIIGIILAFISILTMSVGIMFSIKEFDYLKSHKKTFNIYESITNIKSKLVCYYNEYFPKRKRVNKDIDGNDI